MNYKEEMQSAIFYVQMKAIKENHPEFFESLKSLSEEELSQRIKSFFQDKEICPECGFFHMKEKIDYIEDGSKQNGQRYFTCNKCGKKNNRSKLV